VLSTTAYARKEKTVYRFTGGDDGGDPTGNLVSDSEGNLYGSTALGGNKDYGAIFELTPNSRGTWTETVLYSFAGGSDGTGPVGNLTFDSEGNLYGTTTGGGTYDQSCGSGGCGTVFELTPNAGGGWTEIVIYRFTDFSDGLEPVSGVIVGKEGSLYGTTQNGGSIGDGAVFELKQNSDGSWTKSELYAFSGNQDGSAPIGGLVRDRSGNLFGTTYAGGLYGGGTAFRLSRNSVGWTKTTLHDFTGGRDGQAPMATLTLRNGDLYGTTELGGADNVGIVFKLTPAKRYWKMRVIHGFTGNNYGAQPSLGQLFIDTTGNVYGTTFFGGYYQFGTVYKLTALRPGKWKETVLYNFAEKGDGGVPWGVTEQAGNLYGVTGFGDGAVFEVAP
jgi:uncharacterized repeat protein (TIGR03803 family)